MSNTYQTHPGKIRLVSPWGRATAVTLSVSSSECLFPEHLVTAVILPEHVTRCLFSGTSDSGRYGHGLGSMQMTGVSTESAQSAGCRTQDQGLHGSCAHASHPSRLVTVI